MMRYAHQMSIFSVKGFKNDRNCQQTYTSLYVALWFQLRDERQANMLLSIWIHNDRDRVEVMPRV
jgi:hypothetical protein